MKKIMTSVFAIALLGNAFALDCQRSVVSTALGEMKIEVIISKDDLGGIARLSEVLPIGAIVTYAKTESGAFKIEDNKLKFIWMALPADKDIKVSYTLSTTTLNTGNYNINGKFSYVQDGHAANFELPVTAFLLNDKKEFVLDQSVSASIAKTEPVVMTTKAEAKNIKAGKLVYKVQVGSSKDKLTNEFFSKYKFAYPVESLNTNGMYKYTSGEFTSLEEATKYKEEVTKKGVNDSFILPVFEGKIISVAEAKNLEGSAK